MQNIDLTDESMEVVNLLRIFTSVTLGVGQSIGWFKPFMIQNSNNEKKEDLHAKYYSSHDVRYIGVKSPRGAVQ